MALYRFIGSLAEIGDIELREFGQPVELDDQLAKEAVAGNCAIIRDEEFQAIGFTADELRKHKYVGARQNAPAEFKRKFATALAAFHAVYYGADLKSSEPAHDDEHN